MKYKKYFNVFLFQEYYLVGGLGDIAGAYDSMKEIKVLFSNPKVRSDNIEIIDRDTWRLQNDYMSKMWK